MRWFWEIRFREEFRRVWFINIILTVSEVWTGSRNLGGLGFDIKSGLGLFIWTTQ